MVVIANALIFVGAVVFLSGVPAATSGKPGGLLVGLALFAVGYLIARDGQGPTS